MEEMSPEQKRWVDASIASLQRIAMKILELPKEQRERQYAVVRQNFEEGLAAHGICGDTGKRWLDLQMEGLRALVRESELGGGASG